MQKNKIKISIDELLSEKRSSKTFDEMIKKEKILQSYIYNIVDDEQAEKITIITKEDLSRFIKRLEKTSIENINVEPSVNKEKNNSTN